MTINDALALHRAGRLAEADEAYRRVLAAEPNQYHALHFLGVLKAQTGDMAASAELIARSLALHADNPLAEFHLAETLCFQDRSDEAIAHYRRAIEGDAGFAAAHGGLARCLVAAGRLEDALAAAEQGLRHNGDADLSAQAGDILRLLQRGAEAQSRYARALETVPGHLAATLGSGYLLYQDGRLGAALAAFDSALAHDPARLAGIRRRLADQAHAPLFDAAVFCRALETAFETMAERARNGLAPTSFSLP